MMIFTKFPLVILLIISLFFSLNILQITAGDTLSESINQDENYQWRVETYDLNYNNSEITLEQENFVYAYLHHYTPIFGKITNLPMEKSGSVYELSIMSEFDRSEYHSIYDKGNFQLTLDGVELDLWTNQGYRGNFTLSNAIFSRDFFNFFVFPTSFQYTNGTQENYFVHESESSDLETGLNQWFSILDYYPEFLVGSELGYQDDLSIYTKTQYKCPDYNKSEFTCNSVDDYSEIAILNSRAINMKTGLLDELNYYYDFLRNNSRVVFDFKLKLVKESTNLEAPISIIPIVLTFIATYIIRINKTKNY